MRRTAPQRSSKNVLRWCSVTLGSRFPAAAGGGDSRIAKTTPALECGGATHPVGCDDGGPRAPGRGGDGGAHTPTWTVREICSVTGSEAARQGGGGGGGGSGGGVFRATGTPH